MEVVIIVKFLWGHVVNSIDFVRFGRSINIYISKLSPFTVLYPMPIAHSATPNQPVKHTMKQTKRNETSKADRAKTKSLASYVY